MLAAPFPTALAVPPPAQPDAGAAPLVLVARALVPLGQAAARLSFGAPATAGPPRRLTGLTIRGLAPRRLHRLRVRCAGTTLLELRSVPDGRGGEISAGDMLAAMSTMDGYADLVVALPGPAALRDVCVQLELSEPAPWSDACIEVVARLA